jgi:hypothetical protein
LGLCGDSVQVRSLPNGAAGAVAGGGDLGDRDIWCTVDVLLKTYGDEAELIATKRADAKLNLSDIDGQRVWRRSGRWFNPPPGQLIALDWSCRRRFGGAATAHRRLNRRRCC